MTVLLKIVDHLGIVMAHAFTQHDWLAVMRILHAVTRSGCAVEMHTGYANDLMMLYAERRMGCRA
jgi:hypothetical protein